MVSRRNYITITIMILILLFMFQFIGVMKDALNEYGTNEYEKTTVTGFGREDMFISDGKTDEEILASGREYIIYTGLSPKNSVGKTVSWWCTYSKRNFLYYPSLKECKVDTSNPPKALVLEGSIFQASDIPVIDLLLEHKVNIIFAGLPPKELIARNAKLKKILGIKSARSNVKLSGMHLFGGFLLGGEAIYEPADEEEEEKRQDLDLELPWYVTGEGTKTYIMGLVEQEEGIQEEDKIKNEMLPAVIWRNNIKNTHVFCINGSYLSNMQGMGILTAIMSEISDYEIYPVVNARNLVIASYPGFANENGEEMDRLYSQPLEQVFRDIVWPVLASMANKSGNKLSLMMTPQFDYSDGIEPDGTHVPFYFKLIKELYSEAGISLDSIHTMSINSKLDYDRRFWTGNALDYEFKAAFSNYLIRFYGLAALGCGYDIDTFVYGNRRNTDEIISYIDDNIILQGVTGSGTKHTYTDDIMLKNIETALAYSNTVIDLQRVVYPESEEDSWEKFNKDMTAIIGTYWKPFNVFDTTVVSESSQKIKRFLSADFTKEQAEDGINIDISNFEEELSFILKTNGKKDISVDGGTIEDIEEGAYLIKAHSGHIEIKWQEKDSQEIYYNGE